MALRLPAKVLASLCNAAALAIDHGSLNQDSFSLVPSVASARSSVIVLSRALPAVLVDILVNASSSSAKE
ncbi:hypothetical protein KC343_g19040, partial [Hortaea werneckii]